jgi:hypothetical protein
MVSITWIAALLPIMLNGGYKYLETLITNIFVILFGRFVRFYYFNSASDKVNTNKIQKYISENRGSSCFNYISNGKEYPTQYIISWKHKYIAYITTEINKQRGRSETFFDITFICLKLPITLNSLENIGKDKKKSTVIDIYHAPGCMWENYQKVKKPFMLSPRPYQQNIIDIITDRYDKNIDNITTCLIYGRSNLGKSMIAKLLAKHYGSACSFDVNLLDIGDPFIKLYTEVSPEEDSPLIIQIDEFDNLVEQIHNYTPVERKIESFAKKVYDKSTYNKFMADTIKCFPYVIFIMTTNKPFSYFNDMDDSYINTHRVETKIELADNGDILNVYH